MKHVKNHVSLCVAAVPFLLLLSSCYSSRKVAYFHDISDTTRVLTQDSLRHFQALIEPDDILDIYVNSLNPQANSVFNLGNVTSSSSMPQVASTGQGSADQGSSSGPRGYRVEEDGSIDFPVFGKMKVAGETTTALRDTLKRRLDDYLKDPVVNVRFLNYKITVLGEVGRPATYIINGERESIIDLLGAAGDLTINGRRDNIMVVREENGKRTFARLDLSSSKVFDSPYYFLKQNDLVYVEPNRAKVVASNDKFVRGMTVVGAVLGLAVSLLLLSKI